MKYVLRFIRDSSRAPAGPAVITSRNIRAKDNSVGVLRVPEGILVAGSINLSHHSRASLVVVLGSLLLLGQRVIANFGCSCMRVTLLLALEFAICLLVSLFEKAQGLVLLVPRTRRLQRNRLSSTDTGNHRLACTDALACSPAPAVIDAAMSSEMDMPVLKVLTVAEVPTEKADPVDPVARQQAKVCTEAGHVTGLS